MGALKKIGHVNFRVANQDVSKRFYTEALGLDVTEEDPVHGGIFMSAGEDFHTIDVSDGRGRMDAGPRPPGLVHVAFLVESVAALREAYVRLLDHDRPRQPTEHLLPRPGWHPPRDLL
jgi:catechol-2,3-dioxygenase